MDITKDRLMKYAGLLVLVPAVYVAVLALSEIKNYRYIGGGTGNIITVTGEGEVFAVPDIAEIGFSVVEEHATLNEAQTVATEKMNAAIAYLRDQGIEERDIKTVNYSANPRYEYRDTAAVSAPSAGGVGAAAARPYFNGGDTRVLVGYEVRQTVSVKVRDTAAAGTVIAGVGQLGVSDIYGPNFMIDDDEALQAEARELAIKDAKKKARELAKDLDVRLVRIMSFSENGGGYPIYMQKTFGAETDAVMSAPAPELPAGENRVSSVVTITYEIR